MIGLQSRSLAAARGSAQRPGLAARSVPARVSRTQLRAVAETKTETKKKKKEEEEETFIDGPEVAPSTAQVQAFLSTLCGDTNIAQVELKLGGFNLRVRRSTDGLTDTAPAAAAAAPAAAYAPASVLVAAEVEGAPVVEESVDESVVPIFAPKVGILRRGKYAAGKRIGKGNLIDEGATVKKGQAVAYVEQLGTFVEVKAPQAGEITKFRLTEGDPVEFGQVVVDLAPFFGGHIIGDSKYA